MTFEVLAKSALQDHAGDLISHGFALLVSGLNRDVVQVHEPRRIFSTAAGPHHYHEPRLRPSLLSVHLASTREYASNYLAIMPPKTSTPRKTTASPSPLKNTYLLAYNALSAALWAGVLYQTVSIGSQEVSNASKDGWITSGEGPFGALQKGLGSGKVYDNLEEYTRMVQSLAGLEVLHSIFGTSLALSCIHGN